MTLFLIAIQFSTATIAIGVGVMTLLSKNLKLVNFWLSMTSIFAGLWTLGVAIFITQIDAASAEVTARLFYAAALTIGLCLYFFSRYYPRRKQGGFVEVCTLVLMYLVGLAYSLIPGLLVSSVTMHGANPLGLQTNTVDLNQVTYIYYVIIFSTLAFRAIANIYYSYIDAKIRSQIKIARQIEGILVYISIALAGGMFFNLLLPLMGTYKTVWVGPLFTAVFTVYLFYIVVQQGLLDVRAALARSVGYIMMITIVGVIYGAVLFTVSEFFTQGFTLPTWQMLLYIVLSVVLAFSVRPLQVFLDKWTYGVFYRSDYDLEQTMQEFSATTANEIELGRLVRSSLNVLTKALRPEYVSLYVLASDGKTYHYSKNLVKGSTRRYKYQLDTIQDILDKMPRLIRVNDAQTADIHDAVRKTGASVVVKLLVRDEHVGVLFLGKRQNNAAYSEKDMQMLSTASDELSLAIQNGLRFEEIQQFNKRLRSEINQATKELRRSNRQLHQIDEVKDEFLSIASHQLRTPLTSVKGYISMVLDGDVGKVTDQQRKLLEEAFNSSQRMVSLIEDFLNMSRLQTGRFMVEKHPTSLKSLVENEIDNLRVTAKSHDLTLKFNAVATPGELNLDEGKLRQVVMNFIDNAIYYSKPKTVIRIVMYEKDNSIHVEVHDTGIGVPLQEQGRLFSKFYRASNARKRRPDGTGVGLYLAKKVITAHSGQIIFNSTENKGSVFGFTIPLPKDSVKKSATTASSKKK